MLFKQYVKPHFLFGADSEALELKRQGKGLFAEKKASPQPGRKQGVLSLE